MANQVVSYQIKVSGPLFTRGTVKRAVDRATKRTLAFGKGIIADATPVKTGRLQAGWEDDGDRTIYDEVPYSVYVEDGTRRMAARLMAKRSLPVIQDYYEAAISEELRVLE